MRAETLLGSSPVAGVQVAFRNVNALTVGLVITGTDGKAAIALPATKPSGYWGAFYTVAVSQLPSQHFSVTTTPYTGGTNDLMVPPFEGAGSQPSSFACTVVVSTW